MKDKCIIYINENGFLVDLTTIDNSEFTLEDLAKKDVPEGVEYKIINISDLPQDVYFREAWEADLTKSKVKVSVNLEKAKEIHLNAIRKARETVFNKLDIEFQRALETGADTSVIISKKQTLRDITKDPKILNAKTIEDLKAFWPVLNG